MCGISHERFQTWRETLQSLFIGLSSRATDTASDAFDRDIRHTLKQANCCPSVYCLCPPGGPVAGSGQYRADIVWSDAIANNSIDSISIGFVLIRHV